MPFYLIDRVYAKMIRSLSRRLLKGFATKRNLAIRNYNSIAHEQKLTAYITSRWILAILISRIRMSLV